MQKNKKKKQTKVKKAVSKKSTKKSTQTPHVQIIGTEVDPRKGIRIELDWNEAFITYLRKHGYTGANDEAVVQRWLGELYGQLITDINPEKKSDFE